MISWPLSWKFPLAAVFLVVAVGSGGRTSVLAATVNETHKLTAPVPISFEGFGYAVAISGDRALIGTAGYTVPGAYVFDVPTGQQLYKLIGSDTTRFDGFGTAVAMDGQLAMVGAIGLEAAYLFDIATGQQIFKFIASDGGSNDEFANAVAVSGNQAIVGAPLHNDQRGAAYLFDAQSGQQLSKLTTAGVPGGGDRFGWSVALDGNLAVIGAPGELPRAYIFDVETGQQLYQLVPSGSAPQFFGSRVAISGHTVIVGAAGENHSGLNDAGAAYIFDALTGQELFKLTAADPAANDFFGASVGISDHFAIVGANTADLPQGVDAGAAYLFDLTTGQQVAEITASDSKANAWFGTAGISGNTIIVGAPGVNGLGTGAAYLYSIVPEPSAISSALLLMAISVLRYRR
jgi:outer membrane protein assembly factor BamB